MKKTKNRAQYALLGLLSREPMTGYGIRQWFERAISFFWSESYGQIYPQLRRLEQLGFAEVEEKIEGGRSKKVYKITDAGRLFLSEWLAASTPESSVRLEFLLKIFFADDGPIGTSVRVLGEERQRALEKRQILSDIEAQLLSCESPNIRQTQSLITLRYWTHLNNHTIDWANESIELLGRHATKPN